MRRELLKHFDVLDWFPLKPLEGTALIPLKLYHSVRGAYYERVRAPLFLKGVARMLETRARSERPDLIFAPNSIVATYYEGAIPSFWAADLCFSAYLETYVQAPTRSFVANGHEQEALALARARRVFYPTQWAAEEAVARYGACRRKIDIIPWGANLPREIPRKDVERAIDARKRETCEIVFIGRDWRRKRGDLVLNAVAELNRRGLPTNLTVVGCVPPVPIPPWMKVYPFLDKAREDHWATLTELMLGAHFFFMPSRAEAFGHVFCEAAAFGVVPIGTRVGGIPSVIRDGETGFVMPQNAAAGDYAELIAGVFSDEEAYRNLAVSARNDFEDRLNWDRFGRSLGAALNAAIS